MSYKQPTSYLDIDNRLLADRIEKRGSYYANVIFWTLQFTIPFSGILDYLYLDQWLLVWGVRVGTAIYSYLFYLSFQRKRIDYSTMLHLVIGGFMLCNVIVASTVPADAKVAYFLVLSVFILLINATVFWRPVFSVIHVSFYMVVTVYMYLSDNDLSSINSLAKDGAGIYFVVSIFSCLITANRFALIRRNLERKIVIERSNRLLLEQNEQINEQRIAIEATNRELYKLSQFRNDTLRIIIHDVRSFTSIVTMIMETIQDEREGLSEDIKTAFSHIEESNTRLTHFIQTLVVSTQENQAGKMNYAIASFNLNEEITNTLENLSPNLVIKNIEVTTELESQPVMVSLDKVFVGQALFKLLSNVFRFAENGAVVTIRSFVRGGTTAVMEVVDRSLPNIGQQKLEHMFNELQEGDNVPDKTGFGFSVARRLVEDMGGRLFYASNEEDGNYYRIEFESVKSS